MVMPCFGRFATLWLGLLGASFLLTASAQRQVIIDDTDPRITYSAEGWKEGHNCSDCLAQPNPNQAFNETWHDATLSGSDIPIFFELGFTGTKIEVRCIYIEIIETESLFTTGTNVTITLDGFAENFRREPRDLESYAYNSLLWSSSDLDNTSHRLRIQLLRPSVLLLDQIIITEEDTPTSSTTSTSTSSSSTNEPTQGPDNGEEPSIVGPAVGGAVGGLAVIAAIIIFLLRRKRQKRQVGPAPKESIDEERPGEAAHPTSGFVSPFVMPPQTNQNPSSTNLTTSYKTTSSPSRGPYSNASLYPGSVAGYAGGHLRNSSMTGLTETSAPESTSIAYYNRDSKTASLYTGQYQPPQPPQPVALGPQSYEGDRDNQSELDRRISTRTVPPPYTPGFDWVKTPVSINRQMTPGPISPNNGEVPPVPTIPDGVR